MTTTSSAWAVLHYDNTEAGARCLTDDIGFQPRLVARDVAGTK
jgi:hypothetical protein